jgi:dolichyl-phosphate-mannose-protein mannosyltransferase
MRMLPALMGVSLIPLTYLTLRALGTSVTTATLGGILITFENGLIAQSRLILLDSPLIFFTALTIFLWVKFSNEDYYGTPFSKLWWRYLFLSGLSLGAVVSCKWVGLFTIATVGVCTLNQLWRLLGNLKVSPRAWLRHFFARSLCLIVVPVAFYMAMFQIHFLILNRSGDGDGFMSSEFQHTLIGHGMDDTYAGETMNEIVIAPVTSSDNLLFQTLLLVLMSLFVMSTLKVDTCTPTRIRTQVEVIVSQARKQHTSPHAADLRSPFVQNNKSRCILTEMTTIYGE